jgi:hypothetical protein
VYSAVLTVHSWLRWAALLLAIAATVNAARPLDAGTAAPSTTSSGRSRLPGRWWDTSLMLAVDLQVVVGLFLYFGLSPFTKQAMEDVGAAMRIPTLRFWAIEHAGGMFAAVILVRMGRVLAMNAKEPAAARNRRLVCFAVATVLMLAAVPWPGLSMGRPLFRGL